MRLDLPPGSTRIAVILVTLAGTAFFLARGATSLAAAALFPPVAAAAVGTAPKGGDKPPGSGTPDVKAILKRNIFDRETGPLWPQPAPEPTVAEGEGEEEEVVALAPGQMPPPCEGSLKLVAAVYSERYPDWSFASLSTGSGSPLLYRSGSKVDDKEVVDIYPEAVFLKQANGRLCSSTMFAAEAPEAKNKPKAKARASRAKKASSRSKGRIDKEELDDNITKVSDTKYNVQRSLVDNILKNQAQIMRSARIVPHEQNGQVVGVKLYGIRRSSLLGKLGLQNGDLLRTINGYDMSSPDSALEAYTRLRSANNLTVAVTRRGRAMSLEYEIEQ